MYVEYAFSKQIIWYCINGESWLIFFLLEKVAFIKVTITNTIEINKKKSRATCNLLLSKDAFSGKTSFLYKTEQDLFSGSVKLLVMDAISKQPKPTSERKSRKKPLTIERETDWHIIFFFEVLITSE